MNGGYFLKETWKLFRRNPVSNLAALAGTSLVLLLFALVAAGWMASGEVVKAIQREAEVNVYMVEGLEESAYGREMEAMASIEGVEEVRLVDREEAYGRMVAILGEDAKVLEFFEGNPFSAFVEIRLDLEKTGDVLSNLEALPQVDHVRDNREVLDLLSQGSRLVDVLSWLVLLGVGVTTLVILTHLVRQGIDLHRYEIHTLELLGAPRTFVALPYVMEGVLLMLLGGLMAWGMAVLAVDEFYRQVAGPLPFLPLPDRMWLRGSLFPLVLGASLVLGVAGSFFGLAGARRDD
ncbi:cell division protein FtsX [Anaerotalea alkaliphila]|uniref:Cell division protein FtsX n=1 Tax=Anaerotalea alkaliphila TaxID=2662126 RepID=A0A7X5KNW9_9FIRM|nr:permease-like cell division protein FtsX [Anaerotalea alkaliphila]NDL68253.1 hypothetical protein [Anaerotalea alkaliphila]